MNSIERIRQYLIEYESSRKDKTSRDSVEQFLRDYSALNQRRDILSSHLVHLKDAYEQAKKSAEFRGRKDDPRLKDIEKQLEEAENEFFDTLNAITERCGLVLEIIDLVDDERTKAVLEYYYIQGNSIIEITSLIFYSRTTTIALHGKGLRDIRECLGFTEA